MKGNVSSQGFIYLTKAACEINSANEVGRSISFELLNDTDIANANIKVTRLLQLLCDSHANVDGRRVVSNILDAMAYLNNFIKRFEDAGISIDCDAFEGHYYNIIGALSKSLDYFTNIDSEDDQAHELIDTVSLENRFDIEDEIMALYGSTVNDEVERIKSSW
jgi:hypothetical protein